jgi:hypothetical protein
MQLERVQVRLGKTDAGTPLRRVRVVVVVCIVVRVCMRCRVRANPPTPPTPTCTHPQEGSSEGVHDDDDDDEDRRAPRRRLYYEEIDYPSEYSCSPGMEDDDEVTIEEGDEEGQDREQRSDITRHQSTEADEQPGRVPAHRRAARFPAPLPVKSVRTRMNTRVGATGGIGRSVVRQTLRSASCAWGDDECGGGCVVVAGWDDDERALRVWGFRVLGFRVLGF